tara:strand:- start:823 stop:1497 length:675 start_codon:yes stop_codon:yes gene_type:complete
MNTEITIPENLNEISLWDYQQFIKIENPTPVDVLKTFLHLSERVIKSMKKVQVDSISNHIINLFEKQQPLTSKFKHKGIEYGFIPSLDDISWFENEEVTAHINDWQTMHLAMSVLYRPITNRKKTKYLIEDYNGVQKGMELMPLGIAMGAVVFFYRLTNDVLNYIPKYLAEKVKDRVLDKNGVDTTKYTLLAVETLEGLKRLENYDYTSAIFTLPLKPTKQKKK